MLLFFYYDRCSEALTWGGTANSGSQNLQDSALNDEICCTDARSCTRGWSHSSMDLTHLLDPATAFAHNSYALLQLACALPTLAMGAIIVVRERGSHVGAIYFFITLAIATWFVGFSGGYVAPDAGAADVWIRIGNVGVAFIPTLTLQFTWTVLRPPNRLKWLLVAGWTGSVALAAASLIVPSMFGAPFLYSWGYYGHYNLYSSLLIPFLSIYFSVTLYLYWQAYRRARAGSIAARRAKLLFLAWGIGSFGAIDFLPSYGVDMHPFGFLVVVIGVSITTYVTARYRLLDITPAFAAQHIIENMNDGLLVLDKEGIVRVANSTLLGMIGAAKEEFIGRGIPPSLLRLLSLSELKAIRAGAPMQNREIDFTRSDGTARVLSLGVSTMRAAGQENAAYVGVVRDITERRRAEQRIRHLAYYDHLTNLPNRQSFQEHLRAALARATRHKRMVALLFLDLDHFKRINDTLGHAIGDRLLQTIAARLLGCVRKSRTGATESEATVARLGGDEFIVALSDLQKHDDVTPVAQRILAAVSEPVRLDEHEIAVTASLGVSVYPHDGGDDEALLKNADVAMYQAKDAGRHSYVFYDRALNDVTYDRLSLEAKLRRALERGCLSLHFQPQVVMPTRKPVGVEALLRWNDAELGSIPPERFIPIAEESGLILPIGEWVLKEACAQVRRWQRAGFPSLRLAVNLSIRQFRNRDLAEMVRNALDSARLDPQFLDLELTESMIMQDALNTRRTLEALKEMGVRLSIDDFGTGYSSLSYLRSFPIDTLKIDRSFVRDISADTDNAIVAAIIAMARTLKLEVIAEGVETEAQGAFLQLHGCRLAQGYLFCEPLPGTEVKAWLQSNQTRGAIAAGT
jgi:diguanylate cyclase (GGDEF)-like protein/PAS domain S-box-containing protein